jgi:hypothetical protein
MMETPNEKTIRAKARRRGYYVTKSRQRAHVPNIDNHGAYMLIEADRNLVVLGERYDATLAGLTPETIHKRLARGFSVAAALTTPGGQ